jgi:hypothetical protein
MDYGQTAEMICSNDQGSKLTQRSLPQKSCGEKPECPNLLPSFTIWGTINVYGLQADLQLPMAFEA